MATISTKATEAVKYWGQANSSIERQTALEASTQTFVRGNYLINSSGYLAIAASDNDGDAVGIATKAGQSITAGTARTEYVPMTPGLVLEGNLLEAADADHVLAVAGDMWLLPQWQTTGAHHVFNTTSTTDRFLIVQIGLGAVGDAYGKGGVGDTNCRVFAVPVGSMCLVSSDV